MQILDGKATAKKIIHEVQDEIRKFAKRPPGLAFILIGEHPPSKAYVTAKKKRCAEAGIRSFDHELSDHTTQDHLLGLIRELNEHPEVDGILVQLPLPKHIDESFVLSAIHPTKDVDGFHPLNAGKLLLGDPTSFLPCTPAGIIELAARYNLSFAGKEVVVIGRSNIVGKPLAVLLMQNQPLLNATVTVAHSKTPNLAEVCSRADVVIAAIGKPRAITADMIKPKAIVIDVGINRLANRTLVGDVDFENVAPKCSFITPVPGGVGPMTIAMLLKNTWLSYHRRHKE